jgi:hypothetical protein
MLGLSSTLAQRKKILAIPYVTRHNSRKYGISFELLVQFVFVREIYSERRDGKEVLSLSITDIKVIFNIVIEDTKLFTGESKASILGYTIIAL